MAPMFGLFTCGFMLPFVKSKHALIGACAWLLSLIWIVFRAQADIAMGILQFETKEMSIEGCTYDFDNSSSILGALDKITALLGEAKPLHHISYLYYMPLGTFITIAVAVIASFFLKSDDPEEVDLKLLAPFLRNWYRTKYQCTKKNVPVELGQYNEKTYKFDRVDTNWMKTWWKQHFLPSVYSLFYFLMYFISFIKYFSGKLIKNAHDIDEKI